MPRSPRTSGRDSTPHRPGGGAVDTPCHGPRPDAPASHKAPVRRRRWIWREFVSWGLKRAREHPNRDGNRRRNFPGLMGSKSGEACYIRGWRVRVKPAEAIGWSEVATTEAALI